MSMFRIFQFVSVRIAILILLSCVAASPQQIPSPAIAAVPPAIHAGKKIFVSNAGADSGLFPHPYAGGQDRAYNQFYSDLERWGHFESVSDPQQADLVFELLQLTAPLGPADASKQKGASDPWPMLRLVIFDRKTHYVLCALTESIEPANLQKTHDHNFDKALATVILDLKNLTSSASATAP
jgi:hypothetical protein